MLYKVFAGLPHSDFDTTLVLFYKGGDLADRLLEQGVSVHAGFARSRVDVKGIRKLYELAKTVRPDIILTTTNMMGYFWATVLRRKGLAHSVVVSFHVTRYVRSYYRTFLRARSRWVDYFIGLTPTQTQFWQEQLNIPSDKITVIPNGIDTGYFVPNPEKMALRNQLGLPTEGIVVGNVAYFRPVKNLTRFVQVAHRVAQRIPEAFFVLVGDGTERGGVERAIAEMGLRQRFLLPGELKDPLAWFQAMDIFLLTSDSEALPVVLLEAGSCGVPAVATDVGGVRDVVVHGETGFVHPPNAVDALAESVIQLAQDPALRQQMGQSARQRVVQEFSVEAMVNRHADLFRHLANPTANVSRSGR